MTTPDVSQTTHGSDSLFADGASLHDVVNGDNQSYQNEESPVPNEKKTPISQKAFSVGNPASDTRPFGIASVQRQNKSLLEGKDKQSSLVDVNRVLQSNWLAAQKEEIDRKLIAAQNLKKQRLRDEKAAAAQLERTLPMDLLALDWFNENKVTSELRIYLIDRLLPTLVLGMEKVLIEAEKFGLLDQEYEGNDLGGTFSPINFLAQYLMRNNPRFTLLNLSSPYVRGLKKVAEEMQKEMLAQEENKLAKLKEEAKKKRETMEEAEKRKEEEAKERARLLQKQFPHWLVDNGKLQLQLVQNALYSYLEISSHLASEAENVIHYSKELEPTDESGQTLTVQEYIEYLEGFVCEMTMPEFVQLLRHLDHCAAAFRRTFEREVWREMFMKLFSTLDSENCGFIDRHRMLHLLEKFWDKLDDDDRGCLHNPRKWPVIELEELDDLYLDTEEESGSEETVIVSTEGSSDLASAVRTERTEGSGEDPQTGSSETEQESSGGSGLKSSEEEKSHSTVKESGSSSSNAEKDERSENDEKEEGAEAPTTPERAEVELTKVSSAAGTDALTPEAEKLPEDGVAPLEKSASVAEDEKPEAEEPEAEDKADAKDATSTKEEEEGVGEKDVEETEKAGTDDQESDEKQEEEVKKEEDVQAEEKEKKGEADVKEASKEEDVQKNEEHDVKEEEQSADDVSKVEEPVAKEVEEKEKTPEPRTLLATDSGSLAATLITPAPSTEESRDIGPVNVQFSREDHQPKVRKTTSITTVQKKAPGELPSDAEGATSQDEEEKASMVMPRQESVKDRDIKVDEKDSETVVTTVAAASDAILVQNTAEDMAEYIPQPMEVKTRPISASRMSVTFAAEPLVLPDRPSAEFFSYYSSRSQSRMTSVFDEDQLNIGRFISLLENFLSDDTNHPLVEQLVNFIHGGYVETEEEKMARLEKSRREILSAKHREMVNNLFNKWDNDGQGYVYNEEVDDVLSKYKGGMEASALKRAKQAVRAARKHAPYHDRRRLNRKEFHVYINTVVEAMVGGEEVFDGLIEFVTTTVERTYTERVRGEARRKWLTQILSSAETGGASMDQVYRAVFQTLRKDADSHGNQKKMSSYIALLEHNVTYPERGVVLLRYVACTPDNAPFMLGKAFYDDMKGVSFHAVKRGKLVHIPRVQSHSEIYFWNPMREEGDREGSLVLVPIRDEQRRTFGLLGVDNVDSAAATDRSIFALHEINFYEGIAKSFSNAFHHVDLRKKLLRIVDAAMSWVHSRAPRVHSIVVYFVEPDPKGQGGNVLRKMVTADNNTGLTITHTRPQRLYRKDNLFRDYLFKSMENSETTSADAYGERHTAYPLRDEEGRCQCVIDISIGKLRALPRHENREVQRMLKLLQAANKEVMKESIGGERTVVLEAEVKGSDDMRMDIMFDRLMLTDLRENVSKLDNNVFAELKNYKVPPQMIHNILKAVLLVYNQNPEILEELDDWVTCKQMVTSKLRQWILTYDPTSDQESLQNDEVTDELVQAVGKLLKGIPHGAVARQGSRPAQQLYNWAFVCLSLIEHTRKMRKNEGQPAVTPVTSASTNTTQESLDVPGGY